MVSLRFRKPSIRRTPFLLFAAITGLVTVAGGALPAYAIGGPVGTVNLCPDTEPRGLALDPVTHSVYVANEGTGTVSVISEATNTVTININIGAGSSPEGVGWDPNNDTIWVANNGGTASVICGAPAVGTCGAPNTVIKTVALNYCGGGKGPSRIAVDAADHLVFVGLWQGYIVSVSDLTYGTSLIYNSLSTTHIQLGSYDPNTGLLYASAWDRQSVYEISKTSTATCTASANPVGILNSFNGFAFTNLPTIPEVDPVTAQLFTSDEIAGGNSWDIFDYNGINVPPGAAGWSFGFGPNGEPADFAVDQANGFVYFAVGGTSETVWQANMATGAVKAPVVGSGVNPYGIIVDTTNADPVNTGGGTVFVSNNGSNTVTVYDA
jgi:YVTN family beta-propeller protein